MSTIHKKIANLCSYQVLCCGYVFDGDLVQTSEIDQTAKGPLLRFVGRKAMNASACNSPQQDTQFTGLALPSTVTLLRTLTLPPLKLKEIGPAITDLLEQTLAINLEEACIVYEIVGKNEEQTLVNAYISRNADIEANLKQCQDLNIEPHLIIPKAIALSRFAEHFCLNDWQLILDIDAQEISYLLIHDYKVIETRLVPGSANTFSIESQDSPSSELEAVLQRIFATTKAYKERYNLPPETCLTITGKAAAFELAPTIISEYLQTPLSLLHNLDTNQDILSCASALGTAFCCDPASCSQNTINFREGLFAHQNPFLHWKRPIISFSLASILISAIILWHGFSSKNAITCSMQETWKNITALSHTSPETFAKLHPNSYTATPYTIVESAEILLQDLNKQAIFPLDPDLPRVTDLFTWLVTQINEIQKNVADKELFEIQSLHYTLTKYPSKKSPQERYQLHITLEFTSPSVATARAFHELLTHKNPFLQEATEVSWTPGAGRYKIGFYAKDYTSYPPINP